MKYNRFDVVELTNGNKATILDVRNNTYFIEIVNKNGKSLGTKEILTNEINKIIFKK